MYYLPRQPGTYRIDAAVTFEDKKKETASCEFLVTEMEAIPLPDALYSQKDPYLLRLELTSGGKKITDDFGGKVYVYMTGFVPKTGYKNSNYSGYLLKTDGTTEKVSFYSRDARITVEHFSEYFLSRNVKAASNPTTGDTSNVVVWAGVGLAAVAALAVLLVLSRKKKN